MSRRVSCSGMIWYEDWWMTLWHRIRSRVVPLILVLIDGFNHFSGENGQAQAPGLFQVLGMFL